MYRPPHYRQEDPDTIRSFLRANAFGILINQTNGKLWGTHIPLELEADTNGQDWLVGHVARANPQGQQFQDGEEVLAIFPGPHAYVSSSWYSYEEVPTWNYLAVHVYGKLQLLEGQELLQALHRLIDKYEQASEHPISMEQLSERTLRQVRGIIGFKIAVTEMQAAYKLSQLQSDQDHQRIIHELERRGDAASNAVAEEMRKQSSDRDG